MLEPVIPRHHPREAEFIHDRFGGDMPRAVNEGVLHYWNRIDGVDVDLTRDQFDTWAPDEVGTADPTYVVSSGPTIGARHRRLAAALGD